MDTAIDHDSKFAEKLRSLSLDRAAPEPAAPRIRRRVLGISTLVLATLLLALGLTRSGVLEDVLAGAPDQAETLPAPAATASGDRTDVPNITPQPAAPPIHGVTGIGYVVAPDRATVYAKYEGRIVTIAIDVGDTVSAGQVLARLDDAGSRIALEQAQSARVSAGLSLAARKIALTQARAAFNRTRTLAAKGTSSKSQLEDAETAWKSAENGVVQAKQDLVAADLTVQRAQEQVDELTIRAPIAGTVTRLNAHVGDTLLARVDSVRDGQSLLTIVDTTNLVIDADVAESGIALIRPGLRGQAVLDGFPDQPFTVAVQRIAPTVSMEKGTVTLRLTMSSPPAGTRPNMAARVSIAVAGASLAENQQGAEP